MRWTVALLLVGCGPPPDHLRGRGCRDPQLWYEVRDTGDTGDTGTTDDPDGVYLGCDPPPGWTTDPQGST